MSVLNTTGVPLALPHVTAAQGLAVTTADGRRYLDFESGVWCANLGHGNALVRRALMTQLDQVAHVGYRYSHPIVEAAAADLLRIAGMPQGRAMLLSSGSEAVEFALRLASHVTGRSRFVRLAGHYLSALGLSGALDDPRWLTLDPHGATDVGDLPLDDVAAFVFEPGNASGVVDLPDTELVARLVGQVRAAGGLVVVDEVTTGCGRTGTWFGFQHYPALDGIAVPDLVAIGKGFGNGYPVSAVMVRPEIAAHLDAAPLKYGQSHLNDPLGAAVLREVIAQIEDRDLLTAARLRGRQLQAGLETITARTGALHDVRGRGLMVAATVAGTAPGAGAGMGALGGGGADTGGVSGGVAGAVPGRVVDAGVPGAGVGALGVGVGSDGVGSGGVEALRDRLTERGFLVGAHPATNTLRLYPPLIVDPADIDQFLDVLAEECAVLVQPS